MKLSTEDTKNLKTLLEVCLVADIDSIIIDADSARGANASKTCAIISKANLPKFPQKIGLSRISALKARLDLFQAKDTVIDAKETQRDEISQLEISSSRSKVQFRCTSTMLVKAPKGQINDQLSHTIFLTKDEAKYILDAIKVMGAKKIIVSINNKETTFKISDESNDVFSFQLQTNASAEEDAEEVINTAYTTDIFSAVLRAKFSNIDNAQIQIGQRGSAQLKLMGHDLTMLPQINDEE